MARILGITLLVVSCGGPSQPEDSGLTFANVIPTATATVYTPTASPTIQRVTAVATTVPTATPTETPIPPTPLPTATATPPAPTPHYQVEGVEHWRSLVEEVFSANSVEMVLSIMACESKGDPNAVGRVGERGLMQIHPVHGEWEQAFNPRVNIVAAFRISNGGTDWSPWRNCIPR